MYENAGKVSRHSGWPSVLFFAQNRPENKKLNSFVS